MSQNKHYVLAIDNGTQSVRAQIFDLDGQLVAKSKVDIAPYFSTEPGWAEQEPEYYWEMLCKACNELWPKLDFPKSQIKAVALTTLRATMVNVDKEGKSLRPAFVWLDQRKQDQLDAMNPAWEILFTLARERDAVKYFRTQAEANWIKHQQPEIWNKTYKYLLLSGYHTFKLTDKFVDSVSSQVGYLPFDFKRQDWCRKRDWKWQALPIRPEMLPELIPCVLSLEK